MEKKGNIEEQNIRNLVKDYDKIELVDTLELVGPSRPAIILPYLKLLYKDLTQRSEKPEKGIPRLQFKEVTRLTN